MLPGHGGRARGKIAMEVVVPKLALSLFGAVLATLLIGAASSTVAVGGQASPGHSTVVLSTDRLAVGTRLTISGDGCRGDAGDNVEHLVGAALGDPTNMAVVNPDAVPLTPGRADGSWSITTTLDQPMPTGTYALVARCSKRTGPEMESTLFLYQPAEVTTTSPPIKGLSANGYLLTMDNPCRGITASPPFSPEASSALLGSGSQSIEVEQVTALMTDTPRLTLRAPPTTRPGTYDLQVTCLRHRVAEPVRIVRSSVTLTPATTDPPGAPPAPSGAQPLPGSPAYTG